MDQEERVRKLRHDLGNSLATVLGETQLLLLVDADLSPDTKAALKKIESQVLKMRTRIEEDRKRSREQLKGD